MSGPESKKKLSACDWVICPICSSSRSFAAAGGAFTLMIASHALTEANEVADRADAANARGDRGHFVEWAPFGEFLETAKLGDVELGVGHPAFVVQTNGDLRMTFDAGHRIDDDGLHDDLLTRNVFWF